MATIGGTSGNDTLSGTAGDDTLFGLAGDDTLLGFEGDDSLAGGSGIDFLRGGAGDDTIDGGADFDFVDYRDALAAVIVSLGVAGPQSTGEGNDTLISIEGIVGSQFDDLLTGDAGSNNFRGFGGVDTVDGGDGADSISFTYSAAGVSVDLRLDRVDYAEGTMFFTNIENAQGSSYDDVLIGNDADNRLRPYGGDDTVDGGEGFDTVDYTFGAGYGVIVNLAQGTATGGAGVDTLTSIEAVDGSPYNDTLIGEAGANRLWAGSGNDWLVGRAGDDTLDGGGGFDTVFYRYNDFGGGPVPSGGVTVNLATGVAIDNWGNTDALSNIELAFGSDFDDVLTGGNPANGSGATDGFEGFRGEAGNDTIDGGTGFDRVYYDTSPTGVVVTLGGAAAGSASDGFGTTDTLISIEEVRGSQHADVLTGSDTALFESFEGRGGNDTINGGGGADDRVSYETSPAGVNVDLSLWIASDGFGGTDTLSGIEDVRGSAFDDELRGNDLDNTLDGRAGNDQLFGGDGGDFLTGGAGNDTIDGGAQRIVPNETSQNISNQYDFASFSDATSGVTVALGADGTNGSASGGGIGNDVLIDIEGVIGSSFADVISGSDRAVNEIIRGGAGDDTLSGGTGSGTDLGFNLVDYRFASASVNVDLALGRATGADGNDVLDGFRGILAGAYADTLTGSTSDDYIEGGDGDDVIDGGAGQDRASYGNANGAVNVDLSTGSATGAAGNDTLISIEDVRGSAYADLLVGDAQDNDFEGRAGDDTIQGGAGNDSIHGGNGDDLINGGAGNDIAVYSGTLANYSLQKVGAGYTVSDDVGSEGTDSLSGIEKARFDDMTVNLTIQAQAAAAPLTDVQRMMELYVAFFNRVADADGLEYWIGARVGGQTINEIAESFYSAGVQYPELTGFSPSMTDADFVNVVYRNVLGRQEGADADGLAYWTGELAAGRETHGSLVSTILDSAHTFKGDATWGWVPDLLDNKIEVARIFAIEWGLNYNTAEDSIANGMAIAAAITPTDITAGIALIGIEPGQIELVG